jgi:osmoprotectant transport system substrate-binding protein
MRRNRIFALGATAVALTLMAAACSKSGGSGSSTTSPGGTTAPPRGTITVGVSGAFAENQIVAQMYAQVLEKAGYTVKTQLDLGSREISDQALQSGQIDVKPEYLASELLFQDPNAQASGDASAEVAALTPLLQAKGITLLTPSAAQDTNAFVVTKATADQFGLTTVSDLAKPDANQLVLGGPPECPQRPFCILGLESVYGVDFSDRFKPLDTGGPQTVAALKAGAIQVALLFSTDASIAANGWVVLQDDKSLQSAENITPVVRTAALNDEITSLLNAVSAKLTTDNVTQLVGKVVNDKEDPADVAKQFLTDNGLL